ncbi:MAG: hypothetical protein ACRC44_07320 [Bifidobacterium asteroides]
MTAATAAVMAVLTVLFIFEPFLQIAMYPAITYAAAQIKQGFINRPYS